MYRSIGLTLFVMVALIAALAATPVHAQDAATVAGKVLDAAGNPLPGATVTVPPLAAEPTLSTTKLPPATSFWRTLSELAPLLTATENESSLASSGCTTVRLVVL